MVQSLTSAKSKFLSLQQEWTFPTQEQFLDALEGKTELPENAAILTFDDGFSDHRRFVLPELTSRGLWGVFYITTGVHQTGTLLDVHRIHCLMGSMGVPSLLERLADMVDDSMIVPEHVEAFNTLPYRKQNAGEAPRQVKRLLNYYLADDARTSVLDRLMGDAFDEAAMVESFYMQPGEIREMQDHGMIVGSHTITHPVMSKLSAAEQAREINDSFAFLDDATGGLRLRTFCYPFGGFHTFTDDTERLLAESGCRFAFNVEHRDMTPQDLRERPMALPRYDCNLFPHGQATSGKEPQP